MPYLDKFKYNNVVYDLYGRGGDVLPVGSEIDIASTVTVPPGWEEISNEVVLYNNATGSSDTIILSDNVNNYEYLEVYYKINDGYHSSVKVYDPEDKVVMLMGINGEYDANNAWIKFKNVLISGTSISTEGKQYQEIWVKHNASPEYVRNNDIYITRVVGYKNLQIKRIRKVSQVAPEIMLDDYSTTEQVIGTWIDGKPLYRKVVTIPTTTISTSSATVITIETNTTYDYKNIYGMIKFQTSDMEFPLIGGVSRDNTGYQVRIHEGNLQIVISNTNYSTSGEGSVIGKQIIYEYTKTTDPEPSL